MELCSDYIEKNIYITRLVHRSYEDKSSSQLHVVDMGSRSLKKVSRLLKANCSLKQMIWKFC